MTAESTFLKQLEVYFDLNLNEFDRNRVLGYLKEYRDKLPPKIESREVLRVVEKYVHSNIPCSDKVMVIEAKKVCQELGIDYNEFMSPPSGKSSTEITDARKLYCNRMVSCFSVTRNRLIKFFGVDHATVSYYIIGQKYRADKKLKQQRKTA